MIIFAFGFILGVYVGIMGMCLFIVAKPEKGDFE